MEGTLNPVGVVQPLLQARDCPVQRVVSPDPLSGGWAAGVDRHGGLEIPSSWEGRSLKARSFYS